MRTPEALYTERRARVARDCQGCHAKIEAGNRYFVAALPPWKDVNSSPRWWRLNLCALCGAASPVAGKEENRG